jgi:hypothetical protein
MKKEKLHRKIIEPKKVKKNYVPELSIFNIETVFSVLTT